MGMPSAVTSMLGDLNVLAYDFARPGDILPMHNHDDTTSHIIIVAKGSVVVLVQNPDGQIDSQHFEAGDLIDTFAGFPHGIVCVTAGSRTIHIRKKLQTACPETAAK